jgi:hypothetical protein
MENSYKSGQRDVDFHTDPLIIAPDLNNRILALIHPSIHPFFFFDRYVFKPYVIARIHFERQETGLRWLFYGKTGVIDIEWCGGTQFFSVLLGKLLGVILCVSV